MGPLTTHFFRRSKETVHYQEFLFYDDGDLVVAGYDDRDVTRPLTVAGEVVFDTAFKAFRVQRRGDAYTTIVIYSVDDRFLGYYSDCTLPFGGVRRVPGGGFECEIHDIYLDHFIFPDGRRFVLDLGEFHEGLEGGRISDDEAQLAFETVGWMEEEAAAGTYPTEALQGLTFDPSLLANLPKTQGVEPGPPARLSGNPPAKTGRG
jgi:predicted RNA-binding protein associated with RNAse of E/G family